jgi:hypothetical protein
VGGRVLVPSNPFPYFGIESRLPSARPRGLNIYLIQVSGIEGSEKQVCNTHIAGLGRSLPLIRRPPEALCQCDEPVPSILQCLDRKGDENLAVGNENERDAMSQRELLCGIWTARVVHFARVILRTQFADALRGSVQGWCSACC